MNSKLYIFVLLGFAVLLNTNAQEVSPKNIFIETNLLYFPAYGGGTYGVLTGCRKEILQNRTGWIALEAGIQEDFQFRHEKYPEFGNNTGYSLNNLVNITIGPSFYLLKSHKLIIGMDLFGGWAYKKSDGKVDDEILNIHRRYISSRNLFSRGITVRTGYIISDKWESQLMFKTDLTQLTNFDGITESPGYIIGIGIRSKF